LAIQAQDPRGARLAVRARSTGVSAADINRELSERRTLLITWLNRGTLHLIRSEDYGWLHPLLTPALHTSSLTRLRQNGIDAGAAQRGVGVIARALAAEGPLTRHDLRERLRRAGLPTAGQALVHLLFRATLEGVCVRGPMVGSEHAYVRVADWLGPVRSVGRDRALAELSRRYLAGHGPAADADLARWAGLSLRDARAGLRAIGAELHTRRDGLVDLAKRPRAAPLRPLRLLGAFEPVLMGWRSRRDVLGDDEPVIISGGIFRSFALDGGRAVAGWRLKGRKIQVEPFATAPPLDALALEREGEAVTRFLGLGEPA
ncbi:MAG: winged helix DNA-binding domain-containing protein, partial [Actinomycetota bacterium]|nr:winged helix DNA-binding domain-containing protein [Actinomycetota bacterium]